MSHATNGLTRRAFCAAGAGLATIGFNRLAVAADAPSADKMVTQIAKFKLNKAKEQEALQVLAESRVSEVVIVGRRGPAQAAFTNPELLELGELADADVIVDPAELDRALAVHDSGAEENRRVVFVVETKGQATPDTKTTASIN